MLSIKNDNWSIFQYFLVLFKCKKKSHCFCYHLYPTIDGKVEYDNEPAVLISQAVVACHVLVHLHYKGTRCYRPAYYKKIRLQQVRNIVFPAH